MTHRRLVVVLARSMLVAAVVYAVLAFAWPGLARGYIAAYRGAMSFVYGSFGPVTVQLQALPGGGGWDGAMDTEVVFRGPHPGMARGTRISARLFGFVPTVELIALVMATPGSWRRRGRSLGLGLAAIHVFMALTMLVTLMYFLTDDSQWAIYTTAGWLRQSIVWLYEGVVLAPALNWGVPVLIWAACTLRRGDLEKLLGAAE